MADQNANKYWIWMIRFVLFLTFLDIFKDKSVNSTVEKKELWSKMADQKLNLNINLGESQYLGATSWHDWL